MARRAGKYPPETSKTPQPPKLADLGRICGGFGGVSDDFGGLIVDFARRGGVQKGAVG